MIKLFKRALNALYNILIIMILLPIILIMLLMEIITGGD